MTVGRSLTTEVAADVVACDLERAAAGLFNSWSSWTRPQLINRTTGLSSSAEKSQKRGDRRAGCGGYRARRPRRTLGGSLRSRNARRRAMGKTAHALLRTGRWRAFRTHRRASAVEGFLLRTRPLWVCVPCVLCRVPTQQFNLAAFARMSATRDPSCPTHGCGCCM